MKTCIQCVFLLCVMIGFIIRSGAQGVSISGTVSLPHSSALLDVDASSLNPKKGLLIPRMTMAERNAIPSPATSLLIYQTDNNPGFYYYDGTNWVPLGRYVAGVGISIVGNTINNTGVTASCGTTNFVTKASSSTTLTCSQIYDNGTNIGIGTTTPSAQLHTTGTVRFANYASGANGAVLRTNANGDLQITNFTGNSSDVLLGNGTFGNISSTGAITGSCGTVNMLPKMTSSNTIGCSQIYDNGTYVGIGTTNPTEKLTVNGILDMLVHNINRVDKIQFIDANLGMNGDNTWIGRIDNASDRVRLLVNMGDENTSDFEIGYHHFANGQWYPNFRVNGEGQAYVSGSLGIGIWPPAAQLHTTGTVRFANYASGANGAVLRTDASGNLQITNLTGSATDVLLGNGTFGPAPTPTLQSLTFNNSGSGAASGSSYNGLSALTISYNTIGAVGGSGTATRVAFWSSANTLSSNANLYWDNTNNRLGIGTATPAAQLHTTGTVRFANYASGANGAVLRTNANGDLQITNFTGNSSDVLLGNGTFGSISSTGAITGSCGTVNMLPKMTSSNTIGCSQIYDNGTYVGIGTTNPSHLLTIQSSSLLNILRLIGPGAYGSKARLNFGDGNYICLEEDGDDSLRIFADNRLAIISNGNIGIGTTSPAAKLHVTGTIRFSNYASGANGAVLRTNANGDLQITNFTGNSSDVLLGNGTFGSISSTGAITGSCGTVNMVPKMTSSNSIGCSQIFDNGNGVGINITSPNGRLEVRGTTILNSDWANLDGANIGFLANSGKLLIGWNRSGGAGECNFITNRGAGGLGGFRFSDYTNTGVLNHLVTFLGNGNVGIGITEPLSKLHISAPANEISIRVKNGVTADFEIRHGTTYDGYTNNDGLVFYEVNGHEAHMFGGDVIPDGDYRCYLGVPSRRWRLVYSVDGVSNGSDIRFKKNIEPLKYGLNEVLKLTPISFQWKNDSSNATHLGLKAQELLQIIPEVVDVPKDTADPLGVIYTALIPVLIKAIQEQQALLDQYKSENEKLKAQIGILQSRQEEILSAIEKMKQEIGMVENKMDSK